MRSAVRSGAARSAAAAQHRRERQRRLGQRFRRPFEHRTAVADGHALRFRGDPDRQAAGQRADDRTHFQPADHRAVVSGARRPGRAGRRAGPRNQPDAPADAVQRHPAAGRLHGDAVGQGEPGAGAQPRRRAVHRQVGGSAPDRTPRRAAFASADRARQCGAVVRQRRRRSRSVAAQRRHSDERRGHATRPALPPESRDRRHHHRRDPAPLARLVDVDVARSRWPAGRGAADRRRRPVAAGAEPRAEPRAGAAAGVLHHHGRQPSRSAPGARSSSRAGAPDARDPPIAAAPGRASGASGCGRRARLRRRTRAEQSAAGDPRHAGAAGARPRHLTSGPRRDRVREDAERPRARDHPQPVAVQQPAVGTADPGRSPGRHRRSRAVATPRPRFVQHHAQRRRADRSEGLRQFHRGRTGDAELRHQRTAVDRGCGASTRPHPYPRLRRRQARAPRSAGRWARRHARGRAEAVSALLHDQTGGQGHRPRPLGQLRHHRIVRGHHRSSRQ